MIIVLFHVLYLFGKFVYQNYRTTKQKSINNEAINAEDQLKISDRDYRMIDPEAPQDFEEYSIRFFPPVYIQRYVAVADVLNNSPYEGKLRKVVDFGCAELDFLTYMKNTMGVEEILCVDIDRSSLESYKERGAPLISEYLHTRTIPLVVEICEGSVTHNDRKLENTDAVVCIELIEHLYPDTLTDLPYNIFGYIKPKLVVITTPNADFNVLFPNFSGFRHPDHKFEWSRQQFQDWAENVTFRYPDYVVTFEGIGKGPEGTEHLGCCTQMAIFRRVKDKDICSIGVEGLFKTVAKHEYPYHVDNRSDEQKILDEATYYIRHLSYQDCDMEEEVPLKKLLQMLRSFRISIDMLRTVLEDGGWTIENRDSEPVVLVAPHSTFSDYSTVENREWPSNDYSDTDFDVDDWNREPGPPINSARLLQVDSSEVWDSERWDDEPSIVIPQNNDIVQDNTYLFDAEYVLLNNVSDVPNDTEACESHTEINSEEQLHPVPSIDDVDNSSPILNESLELCSYSFNRKLKGIDEHSILDTSLDIENDAMSTDDRQSNPTLDLPAFLSVSRASTSPQPRLLQSVQLDKYLRDDSLCSRSISNDWTLNASLEQENLSLNITVETDNGEREISTHDSNDLHCIYLNSAYKECRDSDSEHASGNTNMDWFSPDQRKCGQQNRNLSQLKYELQSNSSGTPSGTLPENRPQFTSSPKADTRTANSGKKRRSLDYAKPESNCNLATVNQKSEIAAPSSGVLLETSNSLYLENAGINISSASTSNLSAQEQLYDKELCSILKTDIEVSYNDVKDIKNNCGAHMLTSSDTATISSTSNDDKLAMQELSETCSRSANGNPKKGEIQVNPAAIVRNELANSCLTEESMRVQRERATKNTNYSQTTESDAKLRLDNKTLIIRSESSGESVPEWCDGKTDLDSKTNGSHNSRNINNVNIETTCSHAKDIASLELNGEGRLDCKPENRAIETIENVELKQSFPDNSDTPPNSWSPEIMDSGYPNSVSAQDITPEYDLSSIGQDHPSDSESPSVAEAPRLEVLEVNEVENGDLANNNRDGEGNNMLAAELNELEDLQPLIAVLENDLENENDIYVPGNGFPIWLLRILNMANPMDVEIHLGEDRAPRLPNEGADGVERFGNLEQDEGFDGSSEENSDTENNEMRDDANDANENTLMNNIENDNENENSHADGENERWAAGCT